jgi:hypothetical protein
LGFWSWRTHHPGRSNSVDPNAACRRPCHTLTSPSCYGLFVCGTHTLKKKHKKNCSWRWGPSAWLRNLNSP